MWSPRRALRPIAALAVLLAVAGCGFEPLYGERSSGGGDGRLAVAVAPIPEREGQALRTALRREFDFSREADYRMDVRLAERVETIAIDTRGDVTRRRMTMQANWKLTPAAGRPETPPVEGSARVFDSFNVLQSDYANVSAERAARERAAVRLARIIALDATARVRSAGR